MVAAQLVKLGIFCIRITNQTILWFGLQQGVEKPKGPLEALRPKLQVCLQFLWMSQLEILLDNFDDSLHNPFKTCHLLSPSLRGFGLKKYFGR